MTNVNAYFAGRYSQKEIAQALDVHYATVSRIVKTKTDVPDYDREK